MTPFLPQELFTLLSNQPRRLFALLDAAKDSQILELLQPLDQADYQSLYEGKPGQLSEPEGSFPFPSHQQ